MKRLLIIIYLVLFTGYVNAHDDVNIVRDDIAISIDSERIAYSVRGAGESAIILIHGWSLDSRIWKNQVPFLSNDYKVITIDLGGHGHSSFNREDYTMLSYANDIKVVMERESVSSAILVGHSMGGGVIAEAAKLMPEKVVGIIGVDTSQNVALAFSEEDLDAMTKPFEENFQIAMDQFVAESLPKDTEPALLYWIKEDMSSAPRDSAINQFRNYLGQYVSGESYRVYENVDIPVVLVNARLWPTDSDANRKHIKNYKVYYIENTGHFPMLEKPNKFNEKLMQAIKHVEVSK